MTKHYVLSVIIAIFVVAALIMTMFLLMLPQVTELSTEVVQKYSKIDSDDYEFVQTKEMVTELLSKKFIVSGDAITTYTNNNQYRPGNYDPFTPEETVTTTTNKSTNTTAKTNTSNSTSTSTKSGAVISGTTK